MFFVPIDLACDRSLNADMLELVGRLSIGVWWVSSIVWLDEVEDGLCFVLRCARLKEFEAQSAQEDDGNHVSTGR